MGISLRLRGKLGLPYTVNKLMYCCVNILLTKNVLEHVHLEDKLVQNQLHMQVGWIDVLLIHSRSVSAFPCWSLASIDFNGADLNSFFQCFETRWSLDKCWDYVPPTDAQRLCAGLDSGLLRDDWRVCRKTASPFDWQWFCTIKSHRGSSVPSQIL